MGSGAHHAAWKPEGSGDDGLQKSIGLGPHQSHQEIDGDSPPDPVRGDGAGEEDLLEHVGHEQSDRERCGKGPQGARPASGASQLDQRAASAIPTAEAKRITRARADHTIHTPATSTPPNTI